jgi:hypothetical protein
MNAVRKPFMLVVLMGLVASAATIATPAYASGEITVPPVNILVDVFNQDGVTQQVTTSVSGSNPHIAVSGIGAGLVNSVILFNQNGGSGFACPPASGGWSCTRDFVPGNVININYGVHQNQIVPIGTFTVTVTMDGANAATLTGSGTGEVTHGASDWGFTEALDQAEATGDPVQPQVGLFTLIARNNGPSASAVTVTVTGLDGGAVVPQVSAPCTQSPSTLACTSQQSLPPGANDVFVLQFVDKSPNWPKLKLTAKAAPLYAPDMNQPDSTVVLGPYSGPPLGGSSAGDSTSSKVTSGSTPVPSALPASASASSSPGPSAEPTAEPFTVSAPTTPAVLIGAIPSTGSAPKLAIAAGVAAAVLLGAGLSALRWRRRQRVIGHTSEATEVTAASQDVAGP